AVMIAIDGESGSGYSVVGPLDAQVLFARSLAEDGKYLVRTPTGRLRPMPSLGRWGFYVGNLADC
ncbi:hypothetical protein, partial [Paraburkholderia caledonica]|uniref:hypothetical protein n=1 Tax=Paraburkholderia caledonica TaxID=134536 RepID=UPI001C4E8902